MVTNEAKKGAGFSPLAEKLNGRLAIVGFGLGLVNEEVTGKSLLEQVQTAYDASVEIPEFSLVGGVILITLINHAYSRR